MPRLRGPTQNKGRTAPQPAFFGGKTPDRKQLSSPIGGEKMKIGQQSHPKLLRREPAQRRLDGGGIEALYR